MWIAELRGDRSMALGLLVDPARAGGAPTAITQIHGAAAGMLYRTGHHAEARRELETWFEVASNGEDESMSEETPALVECLVALGTAEMVRAAHEAFEARAARAPHTIVYATLQGRCTGYARGAIAASLGFEHDAEARFNEGLTAAERERCPLDAARCLYGLAGVAERRGNEAEAAARREAAAAICDRHGVSLVVDQLPRA